MIVQLPFNDNPKSLNNRVYQAWSDEIIFKQINSDYWHCIITILVCSTSGILSGIRTATLAESDLTIAEQQRSYLFLYGKIASTDKIPVEWEFKSILSLAVGMSFSVFSDFSLYLLLFTVTFSYAFTRSHSRACLHVTTPFRLFFQWSNSGNSCNGSLKIWKLHPGLENKMNYSGRFSMQEPRLVS